MTDVPSSGDYSIRASSELLDHRTHVLKHDETFGVFALTGDIEPHELSEHGIYHEGTRHLSRLTLKLASERPLLLGSAVTDDNVELLVDLTNPELDGDPPTPQHAVHLLRERLLRDATCHERLIIVNHAADAIRLRLSYEFAADFRDIFEVRGTRRERRGDELAPSVGDDRVVLAYFGLDRHVRQTELRFSPTPTSMSSTCAVFELTLKPRVPVHIELTVACSGMEGARPRERMFEHAERAALEEFDAGAVRICGIESSNRTFDAWVQRASADLQMMTTQTEHGSIVYAGVPWFSAPFGRDALITAMETLTVNPSLAAGALRYLAATQATAIDPDSDAQPGKILHEARTGEMAALGEVPFLRYYGSVDATPMFILLAGAYASRTGDDILIDEIWPQILHALDWIDDYGDSNNDGFIDYHRSTDRGLVNQGWKDSYDSISIEDGSLARGPIALCEVQGYVYGCWRAAAALYARRGEPERAQDLLRRADALRRRFDHVFWQPDLLSYAIAIDGDGQPCRVRASNAGHALLTGIARSNRASALARTLMSSDSFSGWGVRTLSTEAFRYNPMSYHNGSVWPHDNALLARGLARYGRTGDAVTIMTALFESSQWFEGSRLPELFCGLPRRNGRGPTLYPAACAPQSWAAGAVFMLIDACLGIEIDGYRHSLRLIRPTLPSFLDELLLRRLRIGTSVVDLRVRRHGDDVSVEVKRRSGEVSVTVVE